MFWKEIRSIPSEIREEYSRYKWSNNLVICFVKPEFFSPNNHSNNKREQVTTSNKIELIINLSKPIPYFIREYEIGHEIDIRLSNDSDNFYKNIFGHFLTFIQSGSILDFDELREKINDFLSFESFSNINSDDITKLSERMFDDYINKYFGKSDQDELISKAIKKNNMKIEGMQNASDRLVNKDYVIFLASYSSFLSESERFNIKKDSIFSISNNEYVDLCNEITHKLMELERKNGCDKFHTKIDIPYIDKIDVKEMSGSDIKSIKSTRRKLKLQHKGEIFDTLKSFSALKYDADNLDISNENQKRGILHSKRDLLYKVLSKDDFERIYDGGMKTKIEDVLNIIISNNIWLLGFDEDDDSVCTSEFSDKNWKPDIAIRNKDNTITMFELKRVDVNVFAWDRSHKSYYIKSDANKAICQIENQHQYLLDNNLSELLTKNDELIIVIGYYSNEIDPRNIRQPEIEHFGSVDEVIKNKKRSIKLLRNQFKNAKIIFFDELEN